MSALTERRIEWAGMAIAFVIVMLMYACNDALPVSPTAHHILEFLIDILGG